MTETAALMQLLVQVGMSERLTHRRLGQRNVSQITVTMGSFEGLESVRKIDKASSLPTLGPA
jgi:hypothetical protein